MPRLSLIKWFRNIPIARKLYFTVGIMASLIVIELMTLLFAINTLSSVRTLVGAEGLWSKAQKGAALSLQKYGTSYDPKDYATYQDFLKVNLGDRKARLELLKQKPDISVVRQGFLEGRFHPDDIDGAINLLRRFHNVSYIQNAIVYWSKADSMIASVQTIAGELHAEITSPAPSKARIDEIMKQLDPVNDSLTHVEDDFSATLGSGSRWLTKTILKLLLALVLAVEISGLSITIFVSRGITTGIGEIIKSAKRIEVGDFNSPSRIYSNDEIGILARSFNEMTAKLEQNITALRSSQKELKEAEAVRSKILSDIVERNKDLEQFSYIVSHNLRAPIANILGIAEVLKLGSLSENENEIMKEEIFTATQKLDDVIKDINYILQLKQEINEQRAPIKFSDLIEDIKISINYLLRNTGASIITDFSQAEDMLTIKSYIYSIFLNLISNSIKYHREHVPPVIEIQSIKTRDSIELIFRDNGMGIDLQKERDEIFGLYRRFHFHTEGKGMGLYLVKTQVELLGGKITVDSEIDKGTEFKIVFTQ